MRPAAGFIFTVNDCAAANVTLLAPFNNGITFTASQGYDNNAGICKIGMPPDHCDNQLFGLDLVPDSSDTGQVLAPVGGTVTWADVGKKNSTGCIGITIDDGLNLTICHFSTLNVVVGVNVPRGKILGTRSTSHVHISLDDRRYGKPFIPVTFNGTHTLEGMPLGSDHDNNGVAYSFSNHYFMVEPEEWQGLTGRSSNMAIL
ncbi:MAG TPA: hypothetical protein VGD98_14305 [Ktedonobacteraceae bacterium]